MSATVETDAIAVGDVVTWADQRDKRSELRFRVLRLYPLEQNAGIREVGKPDAPTRSVPWRWLVRVNPSPTRYP